MVPLKCSVFKMVVSEVFESTCHPHLPMREKQKRSVNKSADIILTKTRLQPHSKSMCQERSHSRFYTSLCIFVKVSVK